MTNLFGRVSKRAPDTELNGWSSRAEPLRVQGKKESDRYGDTKYSGKVRVQTVNRCNDLVETLQRSIKDQRPLPISTEKFHKQETHPFTTLLFPALPPLICAKLTLLVLLVYEGEWRSLCELHCTDFEKPKPQKL